MIHTGFITTLFIKQNNISYNNHYPHDCKTINDGTQLVNTNNMYLYIQEIQNDNGIYITEGRLFSLLNQDTHTHTYILKSGCKTISDGFHSKINHQH